MRRAKTIQSLDRAFRLVEALCEVPDGMRLCDAAEKTGLKEQTAQSLLRTLEAWHVCVQPKRGGVYQLGPTAVRWGRCWMGANLHVPLAQPLLVKLNHDIEEYVLLAEWAGDRIHRSVELQSHGPMSINPAFSDRESWHTMATAKVLIAHLAPETRRERIAAMSFRPAGPGAICDRERWAKALSRVWRRGYAESIDEAAEGICAIAVPVRRPDTHVAALGLSTPNVHYRKRRKRLLQSLKTTATAIESAWNGAPRDDCSGS